MEPCALQETFFDSLRCSTNRLGNMHQTLVLRLACNSAILPRSHLATLRLAFTHRVQFHLLLPRPRRPSYGCTPEHQGAGSEYGIAERCMRLCKPGAKAG